MFTFSVTAIHAVITRGRIDARMNGGFRNPHYGLAPGKDEKPGVWLVGDEGVYIMSNGKLADGQRSFVIYAEECDPKTNPDYWHYKRQYFGGDDGIDFLDAELLVRSIEALASATHLTIEMTDDSMAITPIRR
ncbi:MAG: DUF3085 domain-containing protein [Afipia sp.]|jgi:hypothetical protein|uniref:DUF3085 domain-containing protein n=2 Tax=Nitrobacteraceae TaxID=41294 RepID=A0A7C9RJQ4_9BRAD|nr:DUF3085 domain-containing protein [Bradyrhizobium denitrificans]MBQ8106565.1 DUF3085 domain-containing protein [Afipia sp.]MBR1139263.1 DUF3085 domain-containing protein [Bradyrhizobium denitrificans]NGX98602.1 DUF3085 domain-containing protein [Candidatus Afipia apatlaquensis]